MVKKNFSNYEIAIAFIISVFVFLSLFIIFKRDWLDDTIFGPLPDESEIITTLDREPEEVKEDIPLVNLSIEPDGEGNARVFLNLEKSSNITGVELYLKTDESLEILNFVCEGFFECIFFESKESEVSIVAIIPLETVGLTRRGELLVGSMEYKGEGVLSLEEGSFLSEMEDPELNILDMGCKEFDF